MKLYHVRKYLTGAGSILILFAAGSVEAVPRSAGNGPGRRMEKGDDAMVEMEKLRNNLKRLLCSKQYADAVDSDALLRQVQPDGSLAGMNYHQEKVRGSAWGPSKHLSIMRQLSVSHPETAGRMLDFWIRTDGTSENWWWPQIGIPSNICKTMLMLGRKVGKDDLQLRAILDRSAIGKTAQNRVWLAEIHLMKGLLFDDPAMVETGRNIILEEIRISDRDGLRDDWSFHQHGVQLQFGNYGLSWFHDTVFWATAMAGTKYAMPPEKIELITRYYINGLRWTLYGDMMDINACGRQIIGNWPQNKYRQVRLNAAILQNTGLLKEMPEPSGSICYPRSGYLIHRCREFFFSVKMSSSKLIGTEMVNQENACGRYSGDGATMLRTRRRWDPEEIALRDWHKVPGTTELQNSDSLCPTRQEPHENKSVYSCFAQGDTAAAMMCFRVTGLRADKAWFCFGKYIVCMGTGIKPVGADPVATTIVQSFRDGTVRIAGANAAEGTTVSAGESWFTSDGMKYLLPEKGRFHFLLDHRNGNWNTINLEHPSSPVSGKMLTVWQEHDPAVPGQYLYVIYPENEPDPEIEYLRGDGITGIRTPDGVMIAFFKPGKILDIGSETSGLYIDFKGMKKFIPVTE